MTTAVLGAAMPWVKFTDITDSILLKVDRSGSGDAVGNRGYFASDAVYRKCASGKLMFAFEASL